MNREAVQWGFHSGSAVKNPPAQCRKRGFDSWVGKIPWRRKWQPTSGLLPGKFYGQRSLEGYCRWSCKESDMTEHRHIYEGQGRFKNSQTGHAILSVKSPRMHATMPLHMLSGMPSTLFSLQSSFLKSGLWHCPRSLPLFWGKSVSLSPLCWGPKLRLHGGH